jgi:hypothetical protein
MSPEGNVEQHLALPKNIKRTVTPLVSKGMQCKSRKAFFVPLLWLLR